MNKLLLILICLFVSFEVKFALELKLGEFLKKYISSYKSNAGKKISEILVNI